MSIVDPSPAPKPHPLQVQSPNLVLGMKKILYSELKTMCLELKNSSSGLRNHRLLGKEKNQRMYSIIPHARLMEFSLGQ